MRLYPIWFRWLLIGSMLLAALVIKARAQELPDAPSRTLDKTFVTVTALTVGAAALDAWSTNRNLDHGYTEQNLILGTRPAKWNVWALTVGESTAWCTVAYFVKRATRNSKSKAVRNIWIFFPALSFGGSTNGWIHNVAIYDPVRFPKQKR